MNTYSTQNDLLLNNLLTFYKKDANFQKMLAVVTGESRVSLRIVDWSSTNYAKKYYTVYIIYDENNELAGVYIPARRFKVYNDYKLKLKAYSKKRFDPFCRWERITVPYKNGSLIQTTIGQLNFFKWVIENKVIEYIEEHYDAIEADMNNRNSTSKKKEAITNSDNSKTRKKREELSISATKSVKREDVEIILSFN